jgi:hypothetical protein
LTPLLTPCESIPALQSVLIDLYTYGGLPYTPSAGTSALTSRSGSFSRINSRGSTASNTSSPPRLPTGKHGRRGAAAAAGEPPLCRDSSGSDASSRAAAPPRIRVSGGGDRADEPTSPLRSRLGGAAAAFKGKLTAAASGARERMNRLADGRSSREASNAGGLAGAAEAAGDEQRRDAATDEQQHAVAVLAAVSAGGAAEPKSHALRQELLQEQEQEEEEPSDQLLHPPAPGGDSPQPPASCHHRRNSSRSMQLGLTEEGPLWGQEDAVVAAPQQAAAH